VTSIIREYETIFILDPGLEEAKEKEEVDRVAKLIKDLDGSVIETERWGRRRLAYEIQKKRDGIYNIFRYNAPSTTVRELERKLRLNEKVLRVLTVVIDPKQKKAMLEMRAAEKAAAEAAAAAIAATAEASPGGPSVMKAPTAGVKVGEAVAAEVKVAEATKEVVEVAVAAEVEVAEATKAEVEEATKVEVAEATKEQVEAAEALKEKVRVAEDEQSG
jgi:small subunit ribosomal protein S6